MKTKHTPGPWWIQNNSDQLQGQVRVDSDEGAVADCGKNFGPAADISGMLANAQLISAAPELLLACRQVIHDFSALTYGIDWLRDGVPTTPNELEAVEINEMTKRKAIERISKLLAIAIVKAEGGDK